MWCIPSIIGPTPLVGNGLVGEIVMTPKTMFQLNETYHGFRISSSTSWKHRARTPKRRISSTPRRRTTTGGTKSRLRQLQYLLHHQTWTAIRVAHDAAFVVEEHRVA
jgi:hypothetical protein